MVVVMEHCWLGLTVGVDDCIYCQVTPGDVGAFFRNEILPRV